MKIKTEKFEVGGVVGDIHIDDTRQIAFVTYFDQPNLDIFDLSFSKVIRTIKTDSVSSYTGNMTGNHNSFIFLSAPKKLSVLNKDTYAIDRLIDLSAYACGAINSVNILNKKYLVITTNNAIGKRDIRKNVFIVDLASGQIKAIDCGIYVKYSFVNGEDIVVVGNLYEDSRHKSVIRVLAVDRGYDCTTENGVDDLIRIMDDNYDEVLNGFCYLTEDKFSKYAYVRTKNNQFHIRVDKDVQIQLEIINPFVCGAEMQDMTCSVRFSSMEGKYRVDFTGGDIAVGLPTIFLDCETVTGAMDLAEGGKTFYFGADSAIYTVSIK